MNRDEEKRSHNISLNDIPSTENFDRNKPVYISRCTIPFTLVKDFLSYFGRVMPNPGNVEQPDFSPQKNWNLQIEF